MSQHGPMRAADRAATGKGCQGVVQQQARRAHEPRHGERSEPAKRRAS